jgi:hypothetical protein
MKLIQAITLCCTMKQLSVWRISAFAAKPQSTRRVSEQTKKVLALVFARVECYALAWLVEINAKINKS